uniref:Peptidase S1 domain-containing protein n=1 Tax=Leptobrachium leishanense TaxID=445787 RepID=A0A8C5WEZ7_9ANUR
MCRPLWNIRVVSKLLFLLVSMLFVFSPGLSSASACGSRLISGRIVGGADALYGRWPWQAAVNNRVGLICGGSLINEQWVLSAAHCSSTKSPDAKMYLYWHVSLKRIIYHPQYTSTGDRGNIALVELMNPVNFTDYIQPICLPSESVTFPSGLECWVTGNITNPNTLQEVMLPLIDDKLCDQMYHIDSSASNDTTIIQEEKICAGYEEGGQDSCQGDSGGPLVCEVNGTWIQAGVVSGGDGCGFPYRPGVYTLVSAYETWIKTYIPDFTFSNMSIPPPLITGESRHEPAEGRREPAERMCSEGIKQIKS